MYIRFQTSEIDVEGSTKPKGIFQLAYNLLRSNIPEYHDELLNGILVWFDENLEVPTAFSRKKTTSFATKGISRYKDTATEHIKKMYELKLLFDEYDIRGIVSIFL